MVEESRSVGSAAEAPPTQVGSTPVGKASPPQAGSTPAPEGTPAQADSRPAPKAPPAQAGSTPAPEGTPAQTDSTPAPKAPPAQAHSTPAGAAPPETPADPGFLERGGLRRRLRFLRKTRELAYRDLGGLLFELHRLGQQRDDLVRGKLVTLERIDSELRAIEDALHERRSVTVLREAGVTACPRCAAIHGSEDRFCPACGFSMTRSERPIAANPVATPVGTPAQSPATAPPNATTRPKPSPTPPTAVVPPPVAPATAPIAPAASASPGRSAAASAPPAPASPARSSAAPAPPAPPPSDVDQPTEIVEPPTQIVRPGEPPAGKSNRA